MKIICIGDSLTEGDYGVLGKRGIANVHEKNYPYFLQKITNAEVVNCGKCGYTPTSYLNYYKKGNVDVSDADIIIVMLGTNGGLDPKNPINGNDDYCALIKLLQADSKNAVIYVCTPPHVTVDKNKSNCGYADRVNNAVEFVKNFALKNNFRCIELDKCEYFTSASEVIMQPNDGLHFSETGYAVMAMYIYNYIHHHI